MHSPDSENARAGVPGVSEGVRSTEDVERHSDTQGATETQARLLVRRSSKKIGRRHVYVYAIEFDGKLVVTGSHDPETDLARACEA